MKAAQKTQKYMECGLLNFGNIQTKKGIIMKQTRLSKIMPRRK